MDKVEMEAFMRLFAAVFRFDIAPRALGELLPSNNFPLDKNAIEIAAEYAKSR